MIQNYTDKKNKGQAQLEFAESGNILVVERRFDESIGFPYMKPVGETSTKHIRDLIADKQANIAPTLAEIADLEAMLPDVEAKEEELAAIKAAAQQEKKK